MEFRWIEWNVDHIAEHGVTPGEAERVVMAARPPYPESREDNKWRVVGTGVGGRFLQVVYLIEEEGAIFVIHARPLTDNEKRRHRRRMR